jgi:hypothetical protein
MYLSLLILGVIVTMAGAAMIAFGIPINEFGLGNTLIVAGTTAFVGGLILIALSDAVRQLRRIAEGAMARPGTRAMRTTDLFNPALSEASAGSRPPSGPGRIPFPPKPNPEGRNRGAAPFESHLATAPSIDTAEDHLDQPPPFTRRDVPETRALSERDETPLSPQAEPRFAMKLERESDELSESLLATAFSRLDVSLRPAPPAEPPRQPELFESFWPPETRQAKPADAQTALPPAQEETTDSDERTDKPKDSEPVPEPHAVSILKSGVVDGMAYTLYSDGSIEAEMPQGTMRFASISELRVYLDKSA